MIKKILNVMKIATLSGVAITSIALVFFGGLELLFNYLASIHASSTIALCVALGMVAFIIGMVATAMHEFGKP